jgi:hypothetical protein
MEEHKLHFKGTLRDGMDWIQLVRVRSRLGPGYGQVRARLGPG